MLLFILFTTGYFNRNHDTSRDFGSSFFFFLMLYAGETKCPEYAFEPGKVKFGKIQKKGNKAGFSSTLNSHFVTWTQQIIPDYMEISLLSVCGNHGRQRVGHG